MPSSAFFTLLYLSLQLSYYNDTENTHIVNTTHPGLPVPLSPDFLVPRSSCPPISLSHGLLVPLPNAYYFLCSSTYLRFVRYINVIKPQIYKKYFINYPGYLVHLKYLYNYPCRINKIQNTHGNLFNNVWLFCNC